MHWAMSDATVKAEKRVWNNARTRNELDENDYRKKKNNRGNTKHQKL